MHGVRTEDPGTYSEELVKRPELQAFERRVSIITDREGPGLRADVEVRLRSGRSVSATYDADRPAGDPAEHWPRVLRKFESLVVPVLGETKAADLVRAVRQLESIADVRQFTALLALDG
jgi:hypothetical protein